MPERTKVILDTDPGIDDALAILLAVASPEIELRGLSVVGGNVPLAECVANALAVLELAGAPEVPVAVGAALPLLRPPFTAAETHGATGLGHATLPLAKIAPIAEHAVEFMIREVLAAPGEISLVAVGPLTNVALAARREPRFLPSLREIIFMGGAFRADGNCSPLAEFNVFVDPHAAELVFQAGTPLTVIPWDITHHVRLTRADVARLERSGGPIAAFVREATRYYIDFHEATFGYAACSVNDPAALVLAFLPELAEITPVAAAVETNSELTMGKTVGDFGNFWKRSPNLNLVTGFDTPRFIELLLSRYETLIAKQQ